MRRHRFSDSEVVRLVREAGGSVETRYPAGTPGHAQWTYKRPRLKVDRDALVQVLTGMSQLQLREAA